MSAPRYTLPADVPPPPGMTRDDFAAWSLRVCGIKPPPLRRQMKTWAEDAAAMFECSDRNRGCSCFISAPCNWCTDPDNPMNLAEDDDAWEWVEEGGAA